MGDWHQVARVECDDRRLAGALMQCSRVPRIGASPATKITISSGAADIHAGMRRTRSARKAGRPG